MLRFAKTKAKFIGIANSHKKLNMKLTKIRHNNKIPFMAKGIVLLCSFLKYDFMPHKNVKFYIASHKLQEMNTIKQRKVHSEERDSQYCNPRK